MAKLDAATSMTRGRAPDGRHGGRPGRLAEQAPAFRDAGIEGLTVSIGDVHDLETVALVGAHARARCSPRRGPAAAREPRPGPARSVAEGIRAIARNRTLLLLTAVITRDARAAA